MRLPIIACLVVAACADQRTPVVPAPGPHQRVVHDALDSSTVLNDLAAANGAFRQWVAHYQSADPAARSVLVEQGTSLVTTRRTLMRQLLLDSPEQAIALAFTPPERAALPGIIRERVERWHDGMATLHVIAATSPDVAAIAPLERFVTFNDADTNYLQAGVFGRRLAQHTQMNLKLHGVEIDGVIGVTASPLRRLWPSEHFDLPTDYPSTCPTSKNAVDQELVFHAGDTAVGFCMTMHANAYEYQLTEQEVADGTAASAWSTGPKTVLFIRVDFSDRAGDPISEASATSLINTTTNTFYVAASYNQTSMTTTVTATLRMPKAAAAYGGSADNYLGLMSDALVAAKAAGFDANTYTHNIIGSANIFNGWSGRGYVGSKGAWINGDYTLRVVGHELGHNYGVYHANFWNAGQSIIGAGSNVEYGNPFDMMSSGGNASTHFNVWFKRLFDWVPSSEVQVVSASGTYRIFALETAISTGLHGLKVPRTGDPSQRDYWLEFRQAFTSNQSAMNGTLVNFGYPYSGANGSQLLDMTPDGDRNQAALTIGRTFSDPLAGVHLTPVGKGGTTPESLDIVVNVGTFPGNHVPTASIAASATTVASNTAVTFTVTASDTDGDTLAYRWDFDDGSLGPNAAAATKTLGGNRVYNVRCTVSDMKGGLVTVGVPVTVGTPTTFTLTGSISDSLEGVRVSDGTRSTFSKSDGSWQLTSVPAGDFTISASKFNYSFARSFAAPLTVAASATGLDFTASVVTGYTVTGTVMAGGVAVPGATITDGSRTATTNGSGAFTLNPVPNGRYTVTATKPGWAFTSSGTNPIEVNGGNVALNFYATGQFVSGSMPTAGVATAPVVTDGVRTVTCTANGANWGFNMSFVPNGSWNLLAKSPGVSLVPKNFTNPLVVAGAPRNGLTFQLNSAGGVNVTGRVTTGGTPLPGVVVSDGTRSGSTDELGVYTLVGVPAGTYTLTPAFSGQTFVPATKSVTVAASDVTGQDFATSVVNAAPTMVSGPRAAVHPVVGKSVPLSALATDDGGEAALTYTWVQQSTTSTIFSANGTNAAKNTTVTFTQGGTHIFELVVTDAGGLTVRNMITVNVTQVPTQMTVTPTTANVLTGATLQFNGILKDQFAKNMYAERPVFTVQPAAGSVGIYGLFTAAATPGGPFTLTVTEVGKSTTASIWVTPTGAPTLVTPAMATPATVTGTTTVLTVLGGDDMGEAALVYTWSSSSQTPVTFAPNASNAAKTSTATFTAPGNYDFTVKIQDADAHEIASAVSVEVDATATKVALEPQVAMVQVGSTLQFTPTVNDQFNQPLVPQPAVVFSVTGGGTVDGAGLFAAGATTGGPFIVSAKVGAVRGSSTITVSLVPDTAPPSVTLTAPIANSRLVTTTELNATASDNVGVTKVEFYVDALKVGESTVDPYSVMVDFASVADGAHVLTAKAYDAAGNATTSDGVTVVVGALPTDVTPPEVSITVPVAGETGLSVPVVFAASDDVGVVSVKLEVGGTVVRELTSPPWSATIEVDEGPHTLVAIASDASGKSTRSDAVAFAAKATPVVTGVNGGGTTTMADGGAISPGGPVHGGCGCNGTSAAPMGLAMAVLGMLARRKRSRVSI